MKPERKFYYTKKEDLPHIFQDTINAEYSVSESFDIDGEENNTEDNYFDVFSRIETIEVNVRK